MIEPVTWRGLFRVEKYYAPEHAEARARGLSLRPYDTVEAENLLLTAGATALFNRLANLGSVTAFDATNGRIAVGDSATAVAVGQTDLQAVTNKMRKVFDSAPVISTNSYTAVATFATGDANWAWNEAGVANSASGAVLLNRIVQSFGTKTAALTWVTTAILTLA
jgi:hypothetical protein